jgi:hypothetical protein
MNRSRLIPLAKVLSILGFLVLLSSTYYLRSEVLDLNRIGFSADQARSEYELAQLKENYPYEQERYKVAQENYQKQLDELERRYEADQQNYELRRRHYEEMLGLYQTDYDGYVQRLKDEYQPPELPPVPTPPQKPARPQPPQPPEYRQKLMEINNEFRSQKYHYFQATALLTWVALAAALCLVGGLLYLILFDDNGRLFYLLTLVLSFVFMIGPSFHSILSAIVGFLEAPRVY